MINSVKFSPMQKPLQLQPQKAVKFGQNKALDEFMKLSGKDITTSWGVEQYSEKAKFFLNGSADIKKRESIANKASSVLLNTSIPKERIDAVKEAATEAVYVQRQRALMAENELGTLKELYLNRV